MCSSGTVLAEKLPWTAGTPLRATLFPRVKVPDALKKFDESIRVSLSAITNTDMDGKTWRRVTLPVSLGGLSIRRTEEIALSAYLVPIHSV